MLNIMYVVGPIIFACIIFIIIRDVLKRSVEFKKFDAMVADTNDKTVLEYLDAFKNSRNFNTRAGANSDPVMIRDNAKRVQAWELVKESPNVSQNVKDQMGKLFIKEKVIIKM